jgi:hypothetical protein
MTIATASALRRAQGVSAFSFDVVDTLLERTGRYYRAHNNDGVTQIPCA